MFFLGFKEVDLFVIFKLIKIFIFLLIVDCINVVCDDNNECMMDICDLLTGACVYMNKNVGVCNDNNVCIVGESCNNGVCVGGMLLLSCLCQSIVDCSIFEDGNICNGIFVCLGNNCVVDQIMIIICDSVGDIVCFKN